MDTNDVRVDGSAVVERLADGTLKTTDGQDNVIGLGALEGGALGLLIGVLGGPVGVLLGFGTGALMGSAFDADRAVSADGALAQMSAAVPPGHTALVAELVESNTAAVDGLASQTGAVLLRRDEDEVLAELAEAEEAAEAAARSADEAVRAARREDRKEKRDERVAKLKARLSH